MAKEAILDPKSRVYSKNSVKAVSLVALVLFVSLALRLLGIIKLQTEWVPAFLQSSEGTNYERVDFIRHASDDEPLSQLAAERLKQKAAKKHK